MVSGINGGADCKDFRNGYANDRRFTLSAIMPLLLRVIA
jgi:hypothetical protein